MVPSYKKSGFTLIELVIVITLIGIVAAVVPMVFTNSIQGSIDVQRRAELVQSSNIALQKIAYDIKRSVPNSVRMNGNYMEMVPIYESAMYRKSPSSVASSDTLDFSTTDSTFDVFENLVNSDTVLSDAQAVIYNLGLTSGGTPLLGANLYAANPSSDPHNISAKGLTIRDDGSEDYIELDSAHQFSQQSPKQRVYIVNGAVSYHCDPSTRSITQYDNYDIQASQPNSASDFSSAGASSSVLIDNVASCAFRYSSATLVRNAIISIELTLSESDQTVTLLQQVQVTNAP